MNAKHFILTAATLMTLPLAAQETYENAKLIENDLNGTARYVGMGGALEALGADISTIGSNPAGIGLFRHNTVSASGGLVMQGKGTEFANGNKTNASFDQIGVVYSTRTRRNSFLNFAFNYHKGKNFDYILNASNSLHNASQNTQSYLKGFLGAEANGGFSVGKDKDGYYNGYVDDNSNSTAFTWSQTDFLYWNTMIPDAKDSKSYNYLADSYAFNRAHTGYIGNYDFNISGNIHNRIFLGITFGIKDVHYKGYSEYREKLSDGLGQINYSDERKITGTGVDITAGAIFRPVDNSPFRIGVYMKTPTWYDLTTSNYSKINNNATEGGLYDKGNISNSYDYKIWTPWKFGLSLGHTVGNYLAMGLTYEYEDYGSINTRIINGVDGYETTFRDAAMNDHTKKTLKGVSTLKFGMEYKPISNFAVRFGYNYLSPAYEENGQKDTGLASLGSSYSSATDFVNWKSTNRFTFGLGYQIEKFNVDLAYQYSSQQGDFYPFSSMAVRDNATSTTLTNIPTPTKVDNNRSQLLLTLGYHF
ncbi:OmpP1/FadL family transporter [Prevotella dentasini]|uniref:OmpP1/FadL family transporter n=1 Tax=Prevotella dentasini TaxID=589537 RepID=UPI000469A98A|nr:hemin receptor [Prevotella dentasini]